MIVGGAILMSHKHRLAGAVCILITLLMVLVACGPSKPSMGDDIQWGKHRIRLPDQGIYQDTVEILEAVSIYFKLFDRHFNNTGTAVINTGIPRMCRIVFYSNRVDLINSLRRVVPPGQWVNVHCDGYTIGDEIHIYVGYKNTMMSLLHHLIHLNFGDSTHTNPEWQNWDTDAYLAALTMAGNR